MSKKIEELIKKLFDATDEGKPTLDELTNALNEERGLVRQEEKTKLYEELQKKEATNISNQALIKTLKADLGTNDQEFSKLKLRLEEVESTKVSEKEKESKLQEIISDLQKEKKILEEATRKQLLETDEKFKSIYEKMEALTKNFEEKELESYRQSLISVHKFDSELSDLLVGSSTEALDKQASKLLVIQEKREKEKEQMEEKVKELEMQTAKGDVSSLNPLGMQKGSEDEKLLMKDPKGFIDSEHPIALDLRNKLKIPKGAPTMGAKYSNQ